MTPLPRQLRAYKGYNLVAFGERIYGVPFGLPVDWSGEQPVAEGPLLQFTDLQAALEGIRALEQTAKGRVETPAEPIQLGSYLEHNIVRLGKSFVAIPFGIAIDWNEPASLDLPGIILASSEEEARDKIDHVAARRPASLQLLESYRGHNLLLVNESYIAVPHGIPIDWSDPDDWRFNPLLLRASSLEALRRKVMLGVKASRYSLRLPENDAHYFGLRDFISHDQALDELALPEIIEIEPIHTCNMRCIMCHVSYENLSKQRLDIDRTLRALKGVNGRWALLASSYEPSAHPDFGKLVRGLSDLGFKLDMTTNGSLFTDKLLVEIQGANFKFITVSFDGATKETFEYIRRRADFDRTLQRISGLREAFNSTGTYFNVNNTVMRRNLAEVEAAVDLWESKDFDHMGLILMRQRHSDPMLAAETLGNDMEEVHRHFGAAAQRIIERGYRLSLSSPAMLESPLRQQHPEAFTDGVVHSQHPRYRLPINPRDYFQRGYFPGMPVDCRSPFKFARINFNGDVMLCQRFVVGNIYEKTFLEIWYGKKARAVREGLRLPGNEKTCHTCSYYRFCIKAGVLETADPANFVSLSNPSKITSEIEKQDDGTPIFLGLQYNYRKFYWAGEYFGILDYPMYNVDDLGSADDLMLGHEMQQADLIRTDSAAALEAKVNERRKSDPRRVRPYPGAGLPIEALRRFIARHSRHVRR